MATLNVPVYRTEAGVHSNPAVLADYSTHCDNGPFAKKKKFKEVYLNWTGAAWVEIPTWVNGTTIVALKVTNVCTDNFAYINYPINDFRLDQACCNAPCATVNWTFTEEVPGGLEIKVNGVVVVNRDTPATGTFKLQLGDVVQITMPDNGNENHIVVTSSEPEDIYDEVQSIGDHVFSFTAECFTYTITAASNNLP